jgi:hypothetical protein
VHIVRGVDSNPHNLQLLPFYDETLKTICVFCISVIGGNAICWCITIDPRPGPGHSLGADAPPCRQNRRKACSAIANPAKQFRPPSTVVIASPQDSIFFAVIPHLKAE